MIIVVIAMAIIQVRFFHITLTLAANPQQYAIKSPNFCIAFVEPDHGNAIGRVTIQMNSIRLLDQ